MSQFSLTYLIFYYNSLRTSIIVFHLPLKFVYFLYNLCTPNLIPRLSLIWLHVDFPQSPFFSFHFIMNPSVTDSLKRCVIPSVVIKLSFKIHVSLCFLKFSYISMVWIGSFRFLLIPVTLLICSVVSILSNRCFLTFNNFYSPWSSFVFIEVLWLLFSQSDLEIKTTLIVRFCSPLLKKVKLYLRARQ